MAFLLASTSVALFAQGTFGRVNFANRVEGILDAPVFTLSTVGGPGPDYTAELYLVGAGSSLTLLTPASIFQRAGSGPQAIADRYWESRTVEVPGVAPGERAVFRVRVWKTSFGSFTAAQAEDFRAFPIGGFTGNSGESWDFSVAVGGETPANLVGLQAFTLGLIPEPSMTAIFGLGATALLLRMRSARQP